jgi:outer membrane protein assembly factor BamB
MASRDDMIGRWAHGLLLWAVALPGCGRDISPLPPVSTCTQDWIVPATDPVYADSLPVDAPRLVWSLTLDGAPNDYGSGPVLAGDRLVLATGKHLFFVTKDGMQTEDVGENLYACQGSPRGPWSPPTADLEGNVYVLGSQAACSLTPAGQLRWATPRICEAIPSFGGVPPTYQCGAAVLSSDGRLFAGAAGSKVYALDSRTGSALWSAPALSHDLGYRSHFWGGGGNRLWLYIANVGSALLDATSGKMIGPINLGCGSSGVGTLGWMVRYECRGGEKSFDTCHFPAVTDPGGSLRSVAAVTTPGERLVMYDYAVDANGVQTGSSHLTLYNPDGSIAAGPVGADGLPFAVGADGTVYAFMCTTKGPRLAAYARDLQPGWLLDLPGRCSGWWPGGAVLDGDGMLYLTQDGEGYDTTHLFAVQTQSPGLASSSWPHFRHDNRGTAWLDQPVRDPPALDSGALDTDLPPVDGGGVRE